MEFVRRARDLYLETGTRFPRRIIWAMGLIKYAAAKVNTELGLLSSDIGSAIMRVSQELMSGKYDNEVVLDVYQTGSGTGLNMNINEVIAKHAYLDLGVKVHPNDHVNLGQSSNDVVPTAIRVAAVMDYVESLRPAINDLIDSLRRKVDEFSDVIKPGRTHLRDALPVTLGQELSGYLDAFLRDAQLLEHVINYVKGLPIGGTAVGTGFNTHPRFGDEVVKVINEVTGLDFVRVNPFMSMKLLTDLVMLSSAIRVLSLDLYRLGQDIRLMFSGPFTGLNEIDIPTQGEVAGSSIMPGKTNPVTVESLLQAIMQVLGFDKSIEHASMLGEFELSMGIPVIGYDIIMEMRILSEGIRKFTKLVIEEITPNVDFMRKYAERSLALITMITPIIGYDKATELSKELMMGRGIRDVLRELGFSDDEINNILNLKELTKPGFKVQRK